LGKNAQSHSLANDVLWLKRVALFIDRACIMSLQIVHSIRHIIVETAFGQIVPMAKHVRVSQLHKLTNTSLACTIPKRQRDARGFSVLNRPPPTYEGHVPLTVTERLGLALGSGLGSFLDPRRAGMSEVHNHFDIHVLIMKTSLLHLAKQPHNHTS
jgi:hypothetical protein